ncbi:alpha-2,8-sialyltransferase 8B-like [Asterias rubens]|uniref:alpha-2,8-sialyltransferase 8B-like n=1 Tax=Asterias rubens TaxID=7604 RepID=UPI00145515E3|nr:alpha-2,8-sialyltransferase 8B-like [Asterias rubens]
MRSRTTRLSTVAALVSLVAIITLTNTHFLGRRYAATKSTLIIHRNGRPGKGLARVKVTPQIIEVLPRKDDDPPTQKVVPVSLHCKQVCMTGLGGDCYSLDKAVLVYRAKVPTNYMKFRQTAYPIIYVPEPPDEILPPFRDIDRCIMDEHYPDMYLIPRQASCAIVGNGGILSRSGCGPDIDEHDFIMRANLAPVDGYQSDVGRRTQITAFNLEMLNRMYSSIVQSGPTNLDNRILLERIKMLKNSILWYPKSLGKLYQRETIRKLTEKLIDHQYMDVHMAYSWKSISIEKEFGIEGFATLGLDMFAVARTFCTNITLYGFYPFNEGPNGVRVPHHYYEDMDFEYQTTRHDFIFEYNKLKSLEAKGEIKMQTKACIP